MVSQNGTGHMFRTTKGTHSSELTWCAGISKNRADLKVTTKRELTDWNGLGVLGSVSWPYCENIASILSNYPKKAQVEKKRAK